MTFLGDQQIFSLTCDLLKINRQQCAYSLEACRVAPARDGFSRLRPEIGKKLEKYWLCPLPELKKKERISLPPKKLLKNCV